MYEQERILEHTELSIPKDATLQSHSSPSPHDSAYPTHECLSSVEATHPDSSSALDPVDNHVLKTDQELLAVGLTSEESAKVTVMDSVSESADKRSTRLDAESQENFPSPSDQDADLNVVALDGAHTLPTKQEDGGSQELDAGSGEWPSPEGTDQEPSTAWPAATQQQQPMKWINKTALSTMLSEKVSEERVSHALNVCLS